MRTQFGAELTLPVSDAGDHIQGPAAAPVTLLEYGDYECPYCGAAYPTVKQVQAQMGDGLRFVFRNFPISTSHPHAEQAAEAAEAAAAQGRFWEMHDLLYENQSLWKDDVNPRTIFVKFAKDLGLNVWQFSRDLDSAQVRLRIEADEDAAAQQGIEGTPTILINGRQLRAEMTTPNGVRKGIEVTLKPKTEPSP